MANHLCMRHIVHWNSNRRFELIITSLFEKRDCTLDVSGDRASINIVACYSLDLYLVSKR